MNPHQQNLLAFCLSLAGCAVVYFLYRRKPAIGLRAWVGLWLLLGGHYALRSFSVNQAALPLMLSTGCLLLAGLSFWAAAIPEESWRRLRIRYAAGALVALAWSASYGYGRPAEVSLVPPEIGGALLFLAGAAQFWRAARSKESLGQRLFALAGTLTGAGLAGQAAAVAAAGLLAATQLIVNYGLLLLALSMVVTVYEEGFSNIEENLLGLSNLTLATSSFKGGATLEATLEQVLDRLLGVYGLSQGLITVAGTERYPGMHLFRGFGTEIPAEWERRELDSSVTELLGRLGGLLVLRDVQRPGEAGRLESDAALQDFRDVMRHSGARSLLALGLRTQTGVYGAFVLAHPPERAFSASELRLFATLGAQVALAVENFLLIRDANRRAEELHLLNQIGQAMNSTLNPDALLRLIYQEIQKLMDARDFYIALWDEEHDEIRFEVEARGGAFLPKRRRKAGNGLTEYILRTRRPLLLRRDTDQFRAEIGIERSTQLRAASWLGVPILLYDRAIGVIAVQNTEREDAYDEVHLELMRTLAAQAAIALENARLFSEEQRRQRQLAFLNHIARIAISTLNSDEMLAEIAREIQKNLAYDHIGIGLLDYQTKEVEMKAEAGLHALALGRRIPLDAGLIGRVARTGQMQLAGDLLNEKGVQSVLTNARSALCLPIVYADQMLGVLNVESVQESAFQQQDVMILRSLADHLASALHNAFIFQRMQHQAITDGLTGAKTHRFFMEALQGEWKRATRSGRVFSLVLLDLDRFKQVNDTRGHLEGDLVLVRLGKILEQRCRQSNVVARYGGDEFMILLPEAATEQAQILAERLRLWVATDPMLLERGLTASFGLASFPAHGHTPEEIIRAADAGLYLAKHQGGNIVAIAEQFRLQDSRRRGQNLLLDLIDNYSTRVDASGPDLLHEILQALEETYPRFPGDPSELEQVLLEGLWKLAAAVERKAYGALGHMQRVTRYAGLLAAALGLPGHEQDLVSAAAGVHDVGYIGLPVRLLGSGDKFRPDDFLRMQAHVDAGVRLLQALRINGRLVKIVLHHHEFFNGRGYPDGLAADSIPLGARILAIADAYDAITSERLYRAARSAAAALDELERFSGTQFDPVLVEAFLSLMRIEIAEAATS